MSTFALDLDLDAIRLWQRKNGSWDRISQVDVNDPDLPSRMTALRRMAETLADGPLETELVIPPSQILYTTLPLPEGGRAPTSKDVRAGLEGLTPCPVDEMVFDWRRTADGLAVAALDVNTLDEAESFAVTYGFRPMRFSARPDPADFPDSPDFGATQFSRQDAPVSAMPVFSTRRGAIEEPDHPVQNVFTESGDAAPKPAPAKAASGPPKRRKRRKGKPTAAKSDAAAPPADLAVPEDESPANTPKPDEETLPGAVEVKEVEVKEPAPEPEAAKESESKAASERKPEPEPAPEAAGADTGAPLEDERGDRVSAAEPDARPEPVNETATVKPSVPADAPMVAPAAHRPKTPVLPRRARFGTAPAGKKPAAPVPPLPAPTAALPATPAVRPVARAPTASPPLSAQERDTANPFGGSPFAQPAPRNDRVRTALTAAVTVVLLGGLVAAALYLVTPSDLEDFPEITADNEMDDVPATVAPTVTAAGPDTAPLIPADILIPVWPDRRVAGLDPREAPETELQDPGEALDVAAMTARAAAAGSVAPVFSEESAPDRIRSADIWQTPPPPPPEPASDTVEALYLAAIDPRVPVLDAVALPEQPVVGEFPGLRTQPPVPGRRYQLDASGRVIPTPEGVETPDGVRVVLGQPPILPRARPVTAVSAPDPEIALALARIVPRPRPDGLRENTERVLYGGRTLAELATLRPRPRPESAQENPRATEISASSGRTVARSPAPRLRPGAVAAAVAAARSRAATQPSRSEPAAVASAPVSSAPRIPTSASVARQATIPNAINLRRLNLVGVYGSANDRRALIRLPSGRYVKVEVGDRIDGGRVSSIGDGELRYSKGGRTFALKVPSG